MEVGQCGRDRSGAGGSGYGRMERAIALAKKETEGGGAVIGDDDIAVAVVIEIPDRHSCRFGSGRIVDRRCVVLRRNRDHQDCREKTRYESYMPQFHKLSSFRRVYVTLSLTATCFVLVPSS